MATETEWLRMKLNEWQGIASRWRCCDAGLRAAPDPCPWHGWGHRIAEALDRVRAEDTRDALRYLVERVDREVKATDQAPELDFVLMAANEVRHLAVFSGGASAGGRTAPNDK